MQQIIETYGNLLLAAMGKTGNLPLTAKLPDPVFFAVGNHAKPNPCPFHRVKPCTDSRRWHIVGIGYNSIVEVQHQQFHAHGCQLARRQVRKCRDNGLRQQGKWHITFRLCVKMY